MNVQEFVTAYEKHGSLKRVIASKECPVGAFTLRKLYITAVAQGYISKWDKPIPQNGGLKSAKERIKLSIAPPAIKYTPEEIQAAISAMPLGAKVRPEDVPFVWVDEADALLSNKEIQAPFDGAVKAVQAETKPLPETGIKRYIFTCAQNATKIHTTFWLNLMTLADHYSAEVHVSRFLYRKIGLGARSGKEQIEGLREKDDDLWYDPAIADYLSDARLEIAPGLVWCGEMSILPTAERPLSGLESYTGRRSGIFPHPKITLDSVPTVAGDPTKFNYTTGTVTLRNYIHRKAGLKADFHHCYGALLVEVDATGSWWCRQLNGDSDGTIHDLRLKVWNGRISEGYVDAIVWGDIHVAEKDEAVYEAAWAPGGMLDALAPSQQFMHDVLHFRGRSHHELKDPHRMFLRSAQMVTSIQQEVHAVGRFLGWACREWCTTWVVDSNHHHHLARWLREANGLTDPTNAIYWCELNAEVLRCIQKLKKEPNVFALALNRENLLSTVRVLNGDQSCIVCPDRHGGIECGMHGDLGPNGARGSARSLSKMGRRAIIGHSHSARIEDGVYQTGTCGTLEPDWTSGPNSWSHSHVIVYPNGKRAVITMWRGKWRAE